MDEKQFGWYEPDMTRDTETNHKRTQLLRFLGNLPPQTRAHLERLKSEGLVNRSRPDFLWYFMLTSFSTMGNSRGYEGLMSDPDHMKRLEFDRLSAAPPEERRVTIEEVFRQAKIRMPSRKTVWLAQNLLAITELGGLTVANASAFRQVGREAKIAFLKQFVGIGDKYARNIWMDVYDPDFRDAIAIDERIKRISGALGVSFASYGGHEQFYQALAKEAAMEPWELDRVLYWNRDDALKAIAG